MTAPLRVIGENFVLEYKDFGDNPCGRAGLFSANCGAGLTRAAAIAPKREEFAVNELQRNGRD